MIANFGSTASSKVSATVFGGAFSVTLAAGTVRTRYACADAAAGSASATAPTASAWTSRSVTRAGFSGHMEGEGSGQDASADLALQEEPPGAGRRDEDPDG